MKPSSEVVCCLFLFFRITIQLQMSTTSWTQHNFQQSIDPDLSSLLKKTWQYHQIPIFYQHFFMRYLGKASVSEGQLFVRQEIRAMEEQVTYIQSFLKVIPYREGLQQSIRVKVAEMVDLQSELPSIFKGLAKLRTHNFKCAFLLDRVRSKYEKKIPISHSSQGYFYSRFAIKLDKFRKDLSLSRIGCYFECLHEYDPFFIHFNLKTTVAKNAFDDYFHLPAEQLYKYQKMEMTLLEWCGLSSRRKKIKTEPNTKYPEQRGDDERNLNGIKAEFIRESHSKYYYTKDLNPRHYLPEVESEDACEGGQRRTLKEEFFKRIAQRGKNRKTVGYLQDHKHKIQLPNLHNSVKRPASESQSIGSYTTGKITKNRNRAPVSQQHFVGSENRVQRAWQSIGRIDSEIRESPIIDRVKFRRRSQTSGQYSEQKDNSLGSAYFSNSIQSRQKGNTSLVTENQFNISLRPIDVVHFEVPPLQRMPVSPTNQSEVRQSYLPLELKEKSIVLPSHRNQINVKSNDNTFDSLVRTATYTREESGVHNNMKETGSSPRKESLRVDSIPEEDEHAFKASAPKIQSTSPKAHQDHSPSHTNNSFASLPGEKKQIKLVHGKFTVGTFAAYLRSFPFHEDFRGVYNLQEIIQWAGSQQTYVTEFKIKDEPGSIAVASLVPPNNNVLIKMWATSSLVYRHESITVFKKYIDYIEKNTQSNTIFYKGKGIDEIKVAGFTEKKPALFSRVRKTDPKPKNTEFSPFLEFKCSQINFPSIRHRQIIDYPDSQKFTMTNSLSAPFIFQMNPHTLPQVLKETIRLSMDVNTIEEANLTLQKEGFQPFQTKQDYSISKINLLRFGYQSEIKEVFAISDNCFKITGNCLRRQGNKRVLCSMEMSKQKGVMYFGKGYQTIEEFCKQATSRQAIEKTTFIVPMFQKHLYGRYVKAQVQGTDFHGQWQVSFAWEQELKGAIKQDLKDGMSFQGGPFLVMVRLHSIPLYVFRVTQGDTL